MAVAWGCDHVDPAFARSASMKSTGSTAATSPTLVYQIDATQTAAVDGQHRHLKMLLRFFHWFGTEWAAALAFICSDMWQPYLTVVANKAGHALHILDRYHIAKHMSDAIDQVRRAEVCSLRQRGRQRC
jgi:transposase